MKKTNTKPLSITFDRRYFSDEDIADVLSFLSETYAEISDGDELEIANQSNSRS